MKEAEILLLAYILLKRRKRRRHAENILMEQRRKLRARRSRTTTFMSNVFRKGGGHLAITPQYNHTTEPGLNTFDRAEDPLQVKVEATESDELDQSSNEALYNDVCVKEEPVDDWSKEEVPDT